MGAYVLRRLLVAVPVVILVTMVGFVAIKLSPGDPLLGRLPREVIASLSPEDIARWRHELGLDQPLHVQYLAWLTGVLRGEFGYSLVTNRPILGEIGPRIGPTLWLMGVSLALAVIVGVPVGILAAVRQYSKTDYLLGAGTMVVISTPSFVLALLGIYVFGIGLGWLPVGGLATSGAPFSVTDRLTHVILPAAILAVLNGALLMRYTRAAMLEVLSAEYMTTARAKGLAPRVILVRHALRNALIPVVTLVAFLLPELVAGAIIIEQIFDWPGMGLLAVRAASGRDAPMLLALMLIVSLVVLLSSVLADIAAALIDPRVRLGRSDA